MALTLDGHNGNAGGASGTSTTVTLTNSTANALIFVAVFEQVSVTVTSITDSSGQGLMWAQVPGGITPSTLDALEVWWTKAPIAFSGVTITVNFSGSGGFLGLVAFAVAGQSQTSSSSWEDGTATSNGGVGGTPGSLNYTTAHANTMVVASTRFGSTTTPTIASPWTLVDTSSHLGVEYQLVSSASTLTTDAWTAGGGGDENGTVMFAIVQAGAATSSLFRIGKVDGIGTGGPFFNNPIG